MSHAVDQYVAAVPFHLQMPEAGLEFGPIHQLAIITTESVVTGDIAHRNIVRVAETVGPESTRLRQYLAR